MSGTGNDVHGDWLIDATIEELQRRLASGELTSAQLVLMYMERIARFACVRMIRLRESSQITRNIEVLNLDPPSTAPATSGVPLVP